MTNNGWYAIKANQTNFAKLLFMYRLTPTFFNLKIKISKIRLIHECIRYVVIEIYEMART